MDSATNQDIGTRVGTREAHKSTSCGRSFSHWLGPKGATVEHTSETGRVAIQTRFVTDWINLPRDPVQEFSRGLAIDHPRWQCFTTTLPLHEVGRGGDPMTDNNRRSDAMVEYLRACVFVFDCATPGCGRHFRTP